MRLAVLYPDPARGRGKKDASKKGGHVSFALKSGLLPQSVACPLRARTRHRTCASKGKTPPTRAPKEKAPAGGWGWASNFGRQRNNTLTCHPDFNGFED